MNDLKFKNFDITDWKQEDNSDSLVIEGYGAYFGNVDSYGDIIERGAFVKSLNDRAGRIAFCYQHDIWNPIGKIQEIKEDDRGLWLKVKISAAEEDISTKIKEGILREMSIGYRPINSRSEMRDGNQVNILTEIKLIEVSLVTVAANPLAVIENMKREDRINYIAKEFDRLISIVKNENINFEIQKLKSIVLSAAPPVEPVKEKDAPLEPEPEKLSKSEILEAISAGSKAAQSKNELLTALLG